MSSLPEDPAPAVVPGNGKLSGVTVGGPGTHQAELRGGATSGEQVMKFYSFMAIEMGERFSND
jgi:hypothetical protein